MKNISKSILFSGFALLIVFTAFGTMAVNANEQVVITDTDTGTTSELQSRCKRRCFAEWELDKEVCNIMRDIEDFRECRRRADDKLWNCIDTCEREPWYCRLHPWLCITEPTPTEPKTTHN